MDNSPVKIRAPKAMAETTNMIPLTKPAMRLGKILEYFKSSAMFNAQDKQKYNHMYKIM
tara:strand:+ start:198 stop:374 length:177 start_codon:yes stop_codon:yes gene_type:complete